MFVLQQILSKCVLLRAVYELDADVAGNIIHLLCILRPRLTTISTLLVTPRCHVINPCCHVINSGAVCEDTKSERTPSLSDFLSYTLPYL